MWWWLACADPDRPAASGADPCTAPGAICTWMGQPQLAGFGGEDVYRLDDSLYLPVDVTFAPSGEAYVIDLNNHRIRAVDVYGWVHTLVGTGMIGDGGGSAPCWEPCPGSDAALNRPTDVALDPEDPDGLWLAAWNNGRIDRIDLRDGTLRWWSGTGAQGYADGPRTAAQFARPSSVLPVPDGSVWVSDSGNHVLRRIAGDEVETLAGRPGFPGYVGDGGPAADARMHASPTFGSKLALADGAVLVADTQNRVIRRIDLETGVVTTVAGRHVTAGRTRYEDPVSGDLHFTDAGGVPAYGGDGGDASSARFAAPTDVAVAEDGRIYVADADNDCVRVIDPDGAIDTFAGTCTERGFDGDHGSPATEALLSAPFGVAIGPDGGVYVTDTENHVVRRVQP